MHVFSTAFWPVGTRPMEPTTKLASHKRPCGLRELNRHGRGFKRVVNFEHIDHFRPVLLLKVRR
jgi:hypothetical protein